MRPALCAISISAMVFITSCSRSLGSRIINSTASLASMGIVIEGPADMPSSPCNLQENYIPDSSDLSLSLPRSVRLVFHIMNSSDSTQNFSEEKTRGYFWTMMNNASERLRENRKMNLPEGNETRVWPAGYRYKKVPVTGDAGGEGYFFHFDDDNYYFINKGRNRNNYRREVIDKYAAGEDTIINVFIMPHHPDSVAAENYKANSTGIALGNSVKLAGIFETGGPPWQYATLLNHEVGHVLGLKHSWIIRDGCEDTPPNNNCFESDGPPPCDGLASNNLMDYNNSQMAITPCQLGIIHRNFSDTASPQRKLLVKDWCALDTSLTIRINSDVSWKGHRDVRHNIIVEDGGQLSIYCRVSMPQNGTVTVMPGGALYLYNARMHSDCGITWNGIRLVEEDGRSGKVYYKGEVLLENIGLQD